MEVLRSGWEELIMNPAKPERDARFSLPKVREKVIKSSEIKRQLSFCSALQYGQQLFQFTPGSLQQPEA